VTTLIANDFWCAVESAKRRKERKKDVDFDFRLEPAKQTWIQIKIHYGFPPDDSPEVTTDDLPIHSACTTELPEDPKDMLGRLVCMYHVDEWRFGQFTRFWNPPVRDRGNAWMYDITWYHSDSPHMRECGASLGKVQLNNRSQRAGNWLLLKMPVNVGAVSSSSSLFTQQN